MIKELYSAFEELNAGLDRLIIAVKEKRVALIERNSEMLDRITRNEESLIAIINKIERRRLETVKSILGISELPKKFNFDLFYDKLSGEIPAEISDSLKKLRENVKTKAKEIREINKQNFALIESSREFIKMLFQNLQGDKQSFVVNKKV